MPLMEWDNSFELGVTQFDEHHKHLVGLLNRLYDGMDAGASHESLGKILDELIDYATYHFATEEQWMAAYDYPGVLRHCEEHTRFSGRVVEMQNDFHNGRTKLTLELLQFLQNWLTNHILKTDAEYGRFISGLSHQ